ncbi:hypothetical protein ACHAWX_005406 [Stephanocyclus meneghinianus]
MSSPRPISPRKKQQRDFVGSGVSPPSLHQRALFHTLAHSLQRRSPSPPPAKKRRVHEDGDDLDDLMRLYKMAKETMTYCEGRLKKIDPLRDIRVGGTRGKSQLDDDADIQTLRSGSKKPKRDTIGGIPRKFLDLSHFNNFPKKFPEEEVESFHVIDCTDENAPSGGVEDAVHLLSDRSVRLPLSSRENPAPKHPSNRIHIAHAPLPHVNGTYIQEGVYNSAPLFVRVGPPRKFMGKWDCCVVLRREVVAASNEVNDSDALSGGPNVVEASEKMYVWKIGLVPAHTITHPRLIGYYEVEEAGGDCEPPVEGWKVFQEGGRGSAKKVGTLRILFEE